MLENPLSNVSYTNKDFQSIYVELLDVVKKLTYKWDPSISNESDPGVILLKLNALIGDKNNYNIDKNVLENFPETVTQDVSARSLYKQLGYRMPWYNSATTTVAFKWVGKDSNELDDYSLQNPVIVPRFTMVSDTEDKFVYTILDELRFDKNNRLVTAKAIEGIIDTLTVNGNEVIRLNNLDYKNRIYFGLSNVAENGIFIYNNNGNELDYWTMVDNLQVQPLNNKYYEFGIDSRRNLCYIEFPEDIHKLIGNGLIIKYIMSKGVEGNIITNQLTKFYEQPSVQFNDEIKVLDDTLVLVTNTASTTDGTDPETVSQAYNSYRKTAGTFDTLVTLRDYMNAIYNSDLVSNVIVCDRLNDIQSSYKIIKDNHASSVVEIVTKDDDDYIGYQKASLSYDTVPSGVTFYEPLDDGTMTKYTGNNHELDKLYIKTVKSKELEAFDLKMYLLHTPGIIRTNNDYISTFELETPASVLNTQVKMYIQDQKCVQHDFKEIIPNRPCLFRNLYPLDIKIIPTYKLDETQTNDLKATIKKALYEVLNSRNINFGEEANYNLIYDTILNCDDRIKVLILDDFVYTTFAVYWDDEDEKYKQVPISDFNSSNIIEFTSANGNPEAPELLILYNNYVQKFDKSYIEYCYFIDNKDNCNYVYRVNNGELEFYSNKINEFRKDILVKSIIGGTTPLYDNKDNRFLYTIGQIQEAYTSADRIDTSLKIYPFGSKTENSTDEEDNPITVTVPIELTSNSNRVAEYTLKANETLRLTAPSFITPTTYSNYVKFELILNNNYKTTTRNLYLNHSTYEFNTERYFHTPITYRYKTITRDYCPSYNVVNIEANSTDEIKNKISRLYQSNDEELLTFNTIFIVNNKDYYISKQAPKEGELPDIEIVDHNIINNIVSNNYKVKCSSPFNYRTYHSEIDQNTESSWKERIVDVYDITDGYKLKLNTTYSNQKIKDILDTDEEVQHLWSENEIVIRAKLIPSDLISIYEEDALSSDTKWLRGSATVNYEASLYIVKANTEYQLQNNEYITFFYKDTDSADAPYKYKRYSKDTIIKPSFNINGTLQDYAKIAITSLPTSEGEIAYSELPNGTYQTVYGMYDENDLSGSKEISIREVNEVTMNTSNNRYYYFITNNIEENKYKLVPTPNKDNTCYTYYLEADEYFIYTNDTKNSYEIVGPGTLLIFDNDIEDNHTVSGDVKLEVDMIDSSKILTNGISEFINKVKPLDFTVTIREQQIYSFTEGDTITFTINTDAFTDTSTKITSPAFDSDKYTDIDNFTLSYRHDGSTEYLPHINVDIREGKWQGTCRLNINSSYDKPQAIPPSDEFTQRCITINNEQHNSEEYYVFKQLQDLERAPQYKPYTYYTKKPDTNDQGTNTQNSLSGSEIVGYYTEITPEAFNQKLDAYNKGDNDIFDDCYERIKDITKDTNLYLLSDIILSQLGGKNIDITYLKEDGSRQEPYLFMYKKQMLPDYISENSNGLLLKLNECGDTTSFDCEIKHAITNTTIVIPVEIMSDNISLNIKVTDPENEGAYCEAELLSTETPQGLTTPKVYYVKIDSSNIDTTTPRLRLEWSYISGSAKDTDHILIRPIFKGIVNKDTMDKYNINEVDVLSSIRTLDGDDMFNYIYTIEEELLIKDPLEAKSFFNTNHIFNPFTISEGDLVTNRNTVSKISLVNNR